MKGLIAKKLDKFMTKWFGSSWKNSLWGVLAVMPQVAKPVMDYLATVQIPRPALDGVSLLFTLAFILTTKGHNVTGK